MCSVVLEVAVQCQWTNFYHFLRTFLRAYLGRLRDNANDAMTIPSLEVEVAMTSLNGTALTPSAQNVTISASGSTTDAVAKGQLTLAVATFPWSHILALSACQLLNTASYMSTSPLAPFIVLHYFPELAAREVGLYTGILEGAFHLGSVPGAFIWGSFADVYGRRPAILWGLFGTFFSVLVFGFAPNFLVAVIARFMWGLLNGNIGVIKTSLSERTSNAHAARAFAMIGLNSGVGRLTGPAIGGLLAFPTLRFGWSSMIWKDYPFALPCVVMAILTLFTLGAAILVLEETKGLVEEQINITSITTAVKSEKDEKQSSSSFKVNVEEEDDEDGNAVDDDDDEEEEGRGLLTNTTTTKQQQPALPPPVPIQRNSWFIIWNDLLIRHTLIIYASLGALGLVSQEVLPLLLVIPYSEGGFSFDSQSLGFLALSCGVPLLLTQAFAFAPLVERFGVIKILASSLFGFALLISLHPLLTFFSLSTLLVQWTILIVLSWLTVAVRVSAFTAVFIVVANSALPVDRARANGLGQALVSLVRAIGPPVFTPLFSATITQGANTFSALSVWLILAIATAYTALLAHRLPPSVAFKRVA